MEAQTGQPATQDGDETRPQNVLYCERCGSERLHRSHRDSIYERFFLAMVGVRPFRCESCNYRFYARGRHNRMAEPE